MAFSSSFPSPLERTVASALLLLSTPPSKLIVSCCDHGERKRKTRVTTESSSCISSLTTDDQFSPRKEKLRIIAAVAHCHDIKLKVAKKRRSKIYRSFDNKKISSDMVTVETSCLSSSSSASGNSSARSRPKTINGEKTQAAKQRKRRRGGSPPMRRRAEAILKLLSGGCFSEVNIRRVLGDSPETSKALRMLLKQEEVKRSGRGGQKDPYIYTIA